MLFFFGTIAVVIAIGIYFSTEGWAVLHTPRREFVFWVTTITCQVGFTVLSRDSPLRSVVMGVLGGDPHVRASPAQLMGFFGIAVPLVSAYVLSWNQMKELRPYNPTRALRESSAFAHRLPPSARVKQLDVNELLERVAYSNHVRYWVSLLRGKYAERQDKLQKIFEEATPEELNHLLRSTNIPQLLQYGDLAESFVRGRVKAIDHLSPLPKAVAMHALMKINTLPYHRGQRQWIRTLFCSTTGDELTVLKMHLDGTTDYHNLYKLVYTDCTDEDLRKEILAHIKAEGEKVVKLNTEKNVGSPVKILSDVDDTLWSSGGKWPAGIDAAYPHHSVYPGALCFYEELDVKGLSKKDGELGVPGREASGSVDEFSAASTGESVKVTLDIPQERGGGTASLRVSGKDTVEQIQSKVTEQFKIPPWSQKLTLTTGSAGSHSTNSRGHNLVFLSARPHAFKDLTESSTYKRFQSLFDAGRLHTHPTLLAGSLRSGARAIYGDILVMMRSSLASFINLCAALTLNIDEKLKSPPALAPIRKVAEKWADEDSLQQFEQHVLGANANWESVGRFKAETFEKFAALYPEYDFIFIGDDGQGDVLASEIMSEHMGGSSKKPIALIHRVIQERNDTLSSITGKSIEEKEKMWKEKGIFFFDTFIGAATKLLECGLISPRSVHRIGVVARDELLELIYESREFPGWQAALDKMNQDIASANEALKKAAGGNPRVLSIDSVKMPM